MEIVGGGLGLRGLLDGLERGHVELLAQLLGATDGELVLVLFRESVDLGFAVLERLTLEEELLDRHEPRDTLVVSHCTLQGTSPHDMCGEISRVYAV